MAINLIFSHSDFCGPSCKTGLVRDIFESFDYPIFGINIYFLMNSLKTTIN